MFLSCEWTYRKSSIWETICISSSFELYEKEWDDPVAAESFAAWTGCEDRDWGMASGRAELWCVWQIKQARAADSSQRDTRFLSGCCQLVLLCTGVKLYRLKTSGFSSACVLRRRAVLAEVNSPNSYLTHLVDPNATNWGHLWGLILFPTVQLFTSLLILPLEESWC